MEMTLNMGAFQALDQQTMFAVDGGADPYRVNHAKCKFTPEDEKAAIGYTIGLISVCLGGMDAAIVGAITLLGASSLAVGTAGILYGCM